MVHSVGVLCGLLQGAIERTAKNVRHRITERCRIFVGGRTDQVSLADLCEKGSERPMPPSFDLPPNRVDVIEGLERLVGQIRIRCF